MKCIPRLLLHITESKPKWNLTGRTFQRKLPNLHLCWTVMRVLVALLSGRSVNFDFPVGWGSLLRWDDEIVNIQFCIISFRFTLCLTMGVCSLPHWRFLALRAVYWRFALMLLLLFSCLFSSSFVWQLNWVEHWVQKNVGVRLVFFLNMFQCARWITLNATHSLYLR